MLGGERAVRGAAQAALQGRALGWRGRGEGTHIKHALHGFDAGRVKGQRLVEIIRALPTRKVGIRAGARCETRGERAVSGGDGASRIAGKGSRLEVGERARTWNILSMLETLDVSKLSGWLKALAACRVARWAYEAGARCGRGEGTHIKHALHACDLGRVEAQRLVEGIRELPSRKVGIRGEGEVRAGR